MHKLKTVYSMYICMFYVCMHMGQFTIFIFVETDVYEICYFWFSYILSFCLQSSENGLQYSYASFWDFPSAFQPLCSFL